MQLARPASVAVFLFLSSILVGCDGQRMADVKGAVKYDGQVVEQGAIAFYPADGKGPSAGGEIKNGAYTARVPVGEMKVTISWPKAHGPKKKLYENDPKSPEIELKQEALPQKFTSPTETELKFQVKSGTNQKDWELSK